MFLINNVVVCGSMVETMLNKERKAEMKSSHAPFSHIFAKPKNLVFKLITFKITKANARIIIGATWSSHMHVGSMIHI